MENGEGENQQPPAALSVVAPPAETENQNQDNNEALKRQEDHERLTYGRPLSLLERNGRQPRPEPLPSSRWCYRNV